MISTEEKGTFSLHKVWNIVTHFELPLNPILVKKQAPIQFTKHTIYIDSGSSQFTQNQMCYRKCSPKLIRCYNENSGK